MNKNLNAAQEFFGISQNLSYIFVSVFLFLAVFIIIIQILLIKRKSKWSKWMPFLAMIIAIIFILPFAIIIDFNPWGKGINIIKDSNLWYQQITQLSIFIGNIYMILLVVVLVFSVSINLIINFAGFFENKKNKSVFYKSFISFSIISIIILLLTNLYRVFPLYSFDMSNNPAMIFTKNTSPLGLENTQFANMGYWPFFATNFLIMFFFIGNFNVQNNQNANYGIKGTNQLNQGIPIFAVIVICIFALCAIVGIIIGLSRKHKSVIKIKQQNNYLNKIKFVADKPLKWIYFLLPVATLSFFSSSLLQSYIGTFMHLIFVIILFLICALLLSITSATAVMIKFKLSLKQYWKSIITFLNRAFINNDYKKSYENMAELADIIFYKQDKDKYNHKIEDFWSISHIGDACIYAIVLIGYLAFLPSNGYIATANVNGFGFWIAMYIGSIFAMYSTTSIPGNATIAQNLQASCGFNIMCGTNTGIFGSLALWFNPFRIVINLNYVLILMSFSKKNRIIKRSP